MFRWEPEGYCCTKSMVIAPFWLSTEHCWIVITPFWLSADDTYFLSLFMHVTFTLSLCNQNLFFSAYEKALTLFARYSILATALSRRRKYLSSRPFPRMTRARPESDGIIPPSSRGRSQFLLEMAVDLFELSLYAPHVNEQGKHKIYRPTVRWFKERITENIWKRVSKPFHLITTYNIATTTVTITLGKWKDTTLERTNIIFIDKMKLTSMTLETKSKHFSFIHITGKFKLTWHKVTLLLCN